MTIIFPTNLGSNQRHYQEQTLFYPIIIDTIIDVLDTVLWTKVLANKCLSKYLKPLEADQSESSLLLVNYLIVQEWV